MRMLSFDGPFLILMRKRGSTRPYFAMWVDSAALLVKVSPKGSGGE